MCRHATMMLLHVLATFLFLRPAAAADMWILGGHAVSPQDSCNEYIWFGETLFLNPADAPAALQVIDVSSGGAPLAAGQQISMPAHTTVTVPFIRPLESDSTSALWVAHLDVPDVVAAESRIEVENYFLCSLRPPSAFFPTNGRISVPIYRSLQAPNTPRNFLGTDLGGIPSRNNVAVYNSAAVDAHATIELHRACDDSIVSSASVTIPSRTIQQFPLGGVDPQEQCASSAPPPYLGYISVVVDQPSLSWASTLV